MRIKTVNIQRNNEKREFVFDDNINLIYSKENSRGKTTLLRAILYGFGYNIPATDGIKLFDDFIIQIEYIENLKKYLIKRSGDVVDLYIDSEKITYIMPEQIHELHSEIFGIDNITILDNLLATFYIDQEKGWTLLNRGTIIGKNRFNIEDFISALSEKDDQELYSKKNLLKLREVEIKKDIREMCDILNENKKFINYLETLDIYIKVSDNKSIKVNRDNILNYNDNQIFYETRKRELEIELAKVKKELNKIENEIDDRNILFNVKTVADEVDEMLKNVNINEKQIDKIIGQLTRRKQKLIQDLHLILSNDNKYLISIYDTIKKYAKELDFEQYVNISNDVVLTNQLKGKTGRILTQMAFTFKIAYLKEIRKKYGLILPLIIDSPRTSELTDEASTAMIKILDRDFKEHQVIFASVYKFEKISKKTIEMKENLFY